MFFMLLSLSSSKNLFRCSSLFTKSLLSFVIERAASYAFSYTLAKTSLPRMLVRNMLVEIGEFVTKADVFEVTVSGVKSWFSATERLPVFCGDTADIFYFSETIRWLDFSGDVTEMLSAGRVFHASMRRYEILSRI